MNKIIVYGGTFNPCTLAHLNAIQCAKKAIENNDDKIISLFLPTGDKYIKSNKIPSKMRCDMIDKMIQDVQDESIKLCKLEVDSPKQPRTLQTLTQIQENAKDWEIYFLLGADKLSQFDRWYKSNEILEKFHLIVLNRTNKKNELFNLNEILQRDFFQKFSDRIIIAENNNEFYDSISSTLIRKNFYQAPIKEINTWLSPSVIKYIKDNGLYSESIEKEPLKIALAQMKVIPGKPSVNFEKLKEMVKQAKNKNADIIIFPEMCISGYMLADRWYDESFCDYLLSFNDKIKELSDGIGIIWGNIDSRLDLNGRDGRKSRLNCAFFAYNREWCNHKRSSILLKPGIEVKTLNPDYRIFDDSRYFLSSIEVVQQLMDHPDSKQMVDPFIFNKNGSCYLIGLEICEDMWSQEYNSINPTALLTESGCDYIINISASPWNLSKEHLRQERIKFQAKSCGDLFCPFIYVNAVGMQNNGKNVLMFDGESSVYDKHGDLLLSCRDDFEEDFKIMDFKKKTIHQQKENNNKLLNCLIHAIKEFDEQQFNKKMKWIIGLSGGLDSSINAALLTIALGSQRVIGYNLATKYNSNTTKNNAKILADKLNIPIINGNIEQIVDGTINTCNLYGYSDDKISTLVYENIQARVRGHLLSTFAQIENAVICNNGNKVEIALGYCTLYGDTIGCLSPLGDCTKVQLFELASQINTRFGDEIIPSNLIPEIHNNEVIWEMPPSAELKEAQKDPMKWFYHDWLISQLTEYPGYRIEEILSKYLDQSIYDTEIGQWIKYYGLDKEPQEFIKDIEWVLRQLNLSVFKRIQMPPIITISQGSFGFDYRENQTNYEYTASYNKLKQQILAKQNNL